MAIIVTDAFWSQATPVSRASMIERVTRTYGMSGEPDLEAMAGSFLDETVDDLNTFLWEFTRVKETGVTITAGQEYVALTSTFYKESVAYLVHSSGDANPVLAYLPWVHFERARSDIVQQGMPDKYSLFNVESEGRVYLMPSPDTPTATSYTLTIEYYQRINRPSEEDPLHAPREIANTIVYGAQKRLASVVFGAGHQDVGAFATMEELALERLRTIDRRHPDEQARFRIVDNATSKIYKRKERGNVYIRI